MTTTQKPTRRETLSLFRDSGKMRELIVELHSTYVILRLKGKRYKYSATYQQLWAIGAQNAAEERRRAKLEAKRAKKAGRDV